VTRGYISIGSNIDKEANIHSALRVLAYYFGGLMVSSTYEFYNLIVGFDSEKEVKEITQLLKQIEQEHGRTRNCKKFSSRTLDLDLVLYGDLVINDGNLQLPRHEIEHYAFVLEPLAEIAGDLKHPVSGIRYQELWQQFDKSGLQQKPIKPGWSSIE
jgi:2-amino-4-hydroxy-6-hydroxymethyldihydropteridine diphosphokinase